MSQPQRISIAVAMTAALMAGAALAAPASNTAGDASDTPTFYGDVLPILQANCQTCHRPSGLNLGGMIAPMPLMTYRDVRPWARSIARVVQNREMPPWHAAAEYDGVFENERTLSAEEVETVLRWSRAGAPAGESAEAPPAVEWLKSEWSIGEPDLVLSLAEPFHVTDDLEDLNINLPVEVPVDALPEDRYIVAMEYKPGSTAVHHIIGLTVQPGSQGFGGFQMLGGIAPGTEAAYYPEGYGVKIYAGSKFIFQMHYHKEPGAGTEVWDRSSVAFKFADKPVQDLYITAVGDPRKLYVPANTKDHFITSQQTFERGITVLSLLPHMHLRGTYAKYVAILPDGSRRDFLEVPHYDFNWQTGYRFKEPLVLQAGTTVEVTMGYDNTAENPNNPDPSIDVRWGDATTDEMNLGWMTWAYTDPRPDDANPSPISAFGSTGGR